MKPANAPQVVAYERAKTACKPQPGGFQPVFAYSGSIHETVIMFRALPQQNRRKMMMRVMTVLAALLFGGVLSLGATGIANAAPVSSSTLFGATALAVDGGVVKIHGRHCRSRFSRRRGWHRHRRGCRRNWRRGRGWWRGRGWRRRGRRYRHRKGCRIAPNGGVYCRF